jgi:ABC-type protease/lipase transport system fused ATPase/permease subunit
MFNTTSLNIVKTIAQMTVAGGCSKIVHGIVQNNTEPENLVQQAQVIGGSVVLGSMLASHASAHVAQQIDNIDKMIKTRKAVKEATDALKTA